MSVAGGWRAVAADWAELAKARLTGMVLLTTLAGQVAGAGGWPGWRAVGLALAGVGMVAAAAAMLNQVLEREFDGRMRRTRNRPLPAGRVRAGTAAWAGFVLALAGVAWLAVGVNRLTAGLAALTLGIYLFVYTPLKRVSCANTLVGAVAGALPPVLGWTAAANGLGWGAAALFGILFFWQVPHFLAIAWLYREDYAAAGFRMLPLMDPTGWHTGRQAAGAALALVGVGLFPYTMGMAGRGYAAGALVCGCGLAALALAFFGNRSDAAARRLFFGSLLYMPCVVGLMVADGVRG